MGDRGRLLVVGPDVRLRRLVARTLRQARLEVTLANAAPGLIRRRSFDALVFADGIGPDRDAIRAARALTDAPIVVVCAHTEPADRIDFFDAGADDVVEHPFDLEEFVAHVRAHLRRAMRAIDGEEPVVTDAFTIWLADRRFALANGREVRLSPTEWRLVEVLVRRAGHLVGQDEILRAVWGPDAKPGLLRVHLASVRRKVEPAPGAPRYFLTAPGLGLRFDPAIGADRVVRAS